MSPENLIPPSAIIFTLPFFSTSLISIIAVIWGTPIPAIILVVQIDPGPIPIFTASTPAFSNSNAASAVAILPPMISTSLKVFLRVLIVSITFLEWPWALSTTKTSTPASERASALSIVFFSVPIAAATLSLPELSFVASGCWADFSISFIVTRPDKSWFLSRTNTFSILLLYINCITSSCEKPSLTVTNLSNGVIIEETSASIFSAYLKSLPVTIPFNLPSSTTGIPEILNLLVRFFNSSIEFFELIVTGSLTIPLSYFFTAFTSIAWSSIELFLWITPIPPASASEIAIFDSVTVSIAADNNGIFKTILLVSFDEISTSLGRKSL